MKTRKRESERSDGGEGERGTGDRERGDREKERCGDGETGRDGEMGMVEQRKRRQSPIHPVAPSPQRSPRRRAPAPSQNGYSFVKARLILTPPFVVMALTLVAPPEPRFRASSFVRRP